MDEEIKPEKQEQEQIGQVEQIEQLYENKRKELDRIHQDLNELMARLNNFISDQDVCEDAEENIDITDEFCEKQDGPQEKELIKQKFQKGCFNPEDIYICDGVNPPEVDWETLAPFIQSVVGDLKKIRQLNQMTNSVMERIRGLAGKQNNDEIEINEITENDLIQNQIIQNEITQREIEDKGAMED